MERAFVALEHVKRVTGNGEPTIASRDRPLVAARRQDALRIDTMLVPLDLSPVAMQALECTILLAEQFDRRGTLTSDRWGNQVPWMGEDKSEGGNDEIYDPHRRNL
jgi:hypothetical protein